MIVFQCPFCFIGVCLTMKLLTTRQLILSSLKLKCIQKAYSHPRPICSRTNLHQFLQTNPTDVSHRQLIPISAPSNGLPALVTQSQNYTTLFFSYGCTHQKICVQIRTVVLTQIQHDKIFLRNQNAHKVENRCDIQILK